MMQYIAFAIYRDTKRSTLVKKLTSLADKRWSQMSQ